jgi:lysozyme family protein
MTRLAACLAFTFAEEGGYQCSWADPGNWTGGRMQIGELVGTNMGISAPVLAHWRHNATLTRLDMHNLGLPEATAIAGALFGNPLQVEALPPGLDLMAFELAWGSGLQFGGEALQQAVGADPDGFVGPATIAAASAADSGPAIIAMDAASRAKYRSLATFKQFGSGWLARADRRLVAAQAMLAAPVS